LSEHGASNGPPDVVPELLKELKGTSLVFDQRIPLAVGLETDTTA
jgi:hypothetical protein